MFSERVVSQRSAAAAYNEKVLRKALVAIELIQGGCKFAGGQITGSTNDYNGAGFYRLLSGT
jgi:hypothetical protein